MYQSKNKFNCLKARIIHWRPLGPLTKVYISTFDVFMKLLTTHPQLIHWIIVRKPYNSLLICTHLLSKRLIKQYLRSVPLLGCYTTDQVIGEDVVLVGEALDRVPDQEIELLPEILPSPQHRWNVSHPLVVQGHVHTCP